MSIRPFSRIEPLSNPNDPARSIAGFFAVVGAIGAVPGLYGLFIGGAMTLGAVAEMSPLFLPAAAFLGFVVLGYLQLRFYARRVLGGPVSRPRDWWLSTYFYNLVMTLIAVGVFVDGFELGAAGAAVWFGCLSLLALVARSSEPVGH